jgi:hypothetical protein
MIEMLTGRNKAGAERAMAEVMKMRKLDIKTLKKAYAQK